MRIRLVRTGGLAAALRRECQVDTSALPPDEARALTRLVRDANLPAIPAKPTHPARARDAFHYRLTVDDQGRSQTIEVGEESIPSSLRPLIDWLDDRANPRAAP